MEHERQRAIQRRMFEDQMRALEQQQARELLTIPLEAQHLAVSAPTTPPRVNAVLSDDHSPTYRSSLSHSIVDVDVLSKAVGNADKRKSVTYAPSVNHSPELPSGNQSFARPGGAKSMPASRRTSASEHDEELAGHLQGLSLAGERGGISTPSGAIPHSILRSNSGRFTNDYGNVYNAGMMLDQQLDQEMHSAYHSSSLHPQSSYALTDAMRHLPTSDEDKYSNGFASKVRSPHLSFPPFLTSASHTRPLPFLSQMTPPTPIYDGLLANSCRCRPNGPSSTAAVVYPKDWRVRTVAT